MPLRAVPGEARAERRVEHDAAPAHEQSAGAGIPKGASSQWIPLEIRAVARKRVRRLTVYAVDTGLIPLRGTAWIDDPKPWLAKGPTGVAVRALAELAFTIERWE